MLKQINPIVLIVCLILQMTYSCQSGKSTSATELPGEVAFKEAEVVCYESSYAKFGENQRIQLHEYMQLSTNKTNVSGKGAGEKESGDTWFFTFNGVKLNDTVMKVKVDYTVNDTLHFSLSERWITDQKEEEIRVSNRVSKRPGADNYFKVDCENQPEFYKTLFQQK